MWCQLSHVSFARVIYARNMLLHATPDHEMTVWGMPMATPFDSTLNSLIDATLADWALFLAGRVGVPTAATTPVSAAALDTDLSSSLFCDRLFRIDGPTPAVVHLELESSSHL